MYSNVVASRRRALVDALGETYSLDELLHQVIVSLGV